MNERTINYHVGRINEETGEQQLLKFEAYSGLMRQVNSMNSDDSFADARTANRVAAWMNSIDDEVGGKHFYYRVDSDNQTRRIIPDDAPEDVLKWFNEDETEEEEEAQEGE